jgi:hypothetical protein
VYQGWWSLWHPGCIPCLVVSAGNIPDISRSLLTVRAAMHLLALQILATVSSSYLLPTSPGVIRDVSGEERSTTMLHELSSPSRPARTNPLTFSFNLITIDVVSALYTQCSKFGSLSGEAVIFVVTIQTWSNNSRLRRPESPQECSNIRVNLFISNHDKFCDWCQ